MNYFRWFVLASLCLTASSVAAQGVPAPDTAIGSSPLATYDVSSIDNVNPINGNLFLNIPIVSFPQAGHALRLAFRLYYNDKGWTVQYVPSQPGTLAGGTWQKSVSQGAYVARDQHLQIGNDHIAIAESWANGYGPPAITTTNWNSSFVVEPDGAKHYYNDSAYQQCSASGCPQTAGTTSNN